MPSGSNNRGAVAPNGGRPTGTTGSMAPVVVVRPGCEEDAAPLALVHVRAWQAAYLGLMPQEYLDGLDVGRRTEAWRRHLSAGQNDSRLLLATVAGHVLGFTEFGHARDSESGEAGELFALNVHPDHWRAGIGSAVLAAAHVGLTDLGHDRAVLWVVPGNHRARAFYERHGWTVEPDERTAQVQGVTVPEVRYARQVP